MTYADQLHDIIHKLESLIDDIESDGGYPAEAQAWRDAKLLLARSRDRADRARL